GCSASASARLEPSFTRSLTCVTIVLSRSWSTWSMRAISASTSGMPAPRRVASWRVRMAMSEVLIRPVKNCLSLRFFTVPPAPTEPAAARSAVTSVRKMPSLRKSARRARAFSASRTPVTTFPPSRKPLNSKTGTACPLPSEDHVVLHPAQDLGDGGDAAGDLDRAVVAQRLHPPRDRVLLDGVGIDVLENHLADLVVHEHELVDAGPPPEPGTVAVLAPLRPHQHAGAVPLHDLRGDAHLLELRLAGLVGLRAVLAEGANEALRERSHQRGGHEEGLDAHVHQTGDGARRVVGVHGGEHEVTGERRLDGDLRRLEIADLADEDHVRVLAEEGAQRRSEGQADLRLARDLVDPLHLVLDRVLGPQDRQGGVVALVPRGVGRGRLAGGGGGGDQRDPVRAVDELADDLALGGFEADLREAQQDVALVGQTHHAALAACA